MSAEQRGNELPYSVRRMDYCVHGKFYRSETDEKGFDGAYWVPLLTLLRDLDPRRVKSEIEIYEGSIMEYRQSIWDDLLDELDGVGAVDAACMSR